MESIYHSPYIIPMLAWLAAPAVVFFALREVGPIQTLSRWFVGLIVLDAWLTGGWSPLRSTGHAAWLVPWGFSILGDLRYFVMLEVIAGGDRKASLKRIAMLTLAAPVLSLAARFGGFGGDEERVVLVVHEIVFLSIALGLRAFSLPRRVDRASPFTQRVVFGLTDFQIAQYGLWAAADMLLVSGASLDEPAFALRIVPNLLHYVGFLPFALWLARSTSSPTS